MAIPALMALKYVATIVLAQTIALTTIGAQRAIPTHTLVSVVLLSAVATNFSC